MKTSTLRLIPVLLFLSAASAAAVASQSCFAACGAQAFGEAMPQEAAWRQASTQTLTGELAPTSAAREQAIADRAKKMENEVLGIGMPHDTPPIEFFSAEGVKENYILHTDGVKGYTTKIAVSNVGASGVLKGTLELPVSGHTSVADAKTWSKTDEYTVTMEVSSDADGKVWSGKETVLLKDVKSLDLVTSQEITVQLVKGRVLRLYYYRLGLNNGLGAPGGYFEGRTLDIAWDGI